VGGLLAVLAIVLVRPYTTATPVVQPNDNTHRAGRLHAGHLSVRLVASLGTWSPEGPHAAAQEIAAFGEEGEPASAPGPLLRVPAGTEVAVTIRNTLWYDLTVHGLCDHRAVCADVAVAAGALRTVRFTAAMPGTYAYWAARSQTALSKRGLMDSQLGGVLVVDPARGSPPDRILALSIFTDAAHLGDPTIRTIPTINGVSWPFTERLQLKVGDEVRFRVVNLSYESHAMHLHGFHFQVYSKGAGTIPPSQRRLEVTERVGEGEAFAMRWTPTRPGNWLFHCHMLNHMMPDLAAPPNHDAESMQVSGGMAGLVMGITVTGEAASQTVSSLTPDRVTMTIDRDDNRYATHHGYRVGFPGRDAPRIADGPVPGPLLVVERGRPTEIAIENHTPEQTAIHWHGIELDSYYDGVPGFGGTAGSVTPPVAPAGAFVAKFTPPRAGTFIYHTHWHDEDQLRGGLYGPLVVVEPGHRFDPAIDHVAVIGLTRGEGEPHVLNGLQQPAPIVLRAGVANRLRLINITTANANIIVRLTEAGEATTWIPRAQDGVTLPRALQVAGPARTRLPVGGTFDAEIPASGPRRLWLDVRRGNGAWLVQAPVDVR
jgi:FtsP/CotA-like multicopper oxidase with cupredoxin domain